MAVELHRYFAETNFQLRHLSDFLDADGIWLDVEAFARATSIRQYQWIRRLQYEATQFFGHLLALCDKSLFQ